MEPSNTVDPNSHPVVESDHNLDSCGIDQDSDGASQTSEQDDASQTWGDDAYYDSSPTPPPICNAERHPHTLFSVDPWSSHCLEYGGKILVVARTEEECCDILYQEYGGHRSEIECRVRYADTLWLASSNMSSGIWQKILH